MNMNHELMNINHEFKFLWKRRTPQNLSTANKNTLEDLESALNISWNIPPKLGQFIWIPHQNPYGFPTVCLDFSLVLQRSAVQHDMDAPGTFEPGSRVSRKVDGPFQDFLGFKIRKTPWCLNVKPGMMLIIVQKKIFFWGSFTNQFTTTCAESIKDLWRAVIKDRLCAWKARKSTNSCHSRKACLIWILYSMVLVSALVDCTGITFCVCICCWYQTRYRTAGG